MIFKKKGLGIFMLVLILMVTLEMPLTGRLEEISSTTAYAGIKAKVKIGDYIRYGRYKKDPILWRVININDDGSLMLLSERVLCFKAFDAFGDLTDNRGDIYRKNYGSNNWEKSSLREWMNSEEQSVNYSCEKPDKEHVLYGYYSYDTEPGFLSNFTSKELELIQPVTHKSILSEPDSYIKDGDTAFRMYGHTDLPVKRQVTKSYKNVTDKVYLLDVEELYDYVYSRGYDILRKRYSNTETSAGNKDSYNDYWLRSPVTYNSYMTLRVTSLGISDFNWAENYNGAEAASGTVGVVPALNLKPDIEGITGDGTVESPYMLTMEQDAPINGDLNADSSMQRAETNIQGTNGIIINFGNNEKTFSSGSIKWSAVKLNEMVGGERFYAGDNVNAYAANKDTILVNYYGKSANIKIKNDLDQVEIQSYQDKINRFYSIDNKFYALEEWYFDSYRDGKPRETYSIYISDDGDSWSEIKFKMPYSGPKTLPKTIASTRREFITIKDNPFGSIDGKVEGYYLHTRNLFKKDNKYYLAFETLFYGTNKEGKQRYCYEGLDENGKKVKIDNFILESSNLQEWHMYKPNANYWESINKKTDYFLPDKIDAYNSAIKKCFFSRYGKIFNQKNVELELYDSRVVNDGNCKYIGVNIAVEGRKRTLNDKISTVACIFKVDKNNITMIYPSRIEDVKSRINKSTSKEELRLYELIKQGPKFVAIYKDDLLKNFNIKEDNSIIAISTSYINYQLIAQKNRYFFFQGSYELYIGEETKAKK